MRLIDADALCDMCIIQTGSSRCYSCTIFDAPTIDAVPVVRCKDCKYRDRYYCYHPDQKYLAVDIDYYCARGERRDA